MSQDALGGTRTYTICAIAALLAVASAAAQRGAIQKVLREVRKLDVRVGCVVLDQDTGRVLFRSHADRAFTPASNQKVLTAVAALEGLGEDYEFETVFRMDAGVLKVAPSGDPNWTTGGDHEPAAIMADVAARLVELGVTSVSGIELETGPFGGPLRPAGWPADQLSYYYCPPTGGFVLEQGCFRARIAPGQNGVADIEVIAPPEGLAVEGQLRLTPNKRRGGQYRVWEQAGTLNASGYYYSRSKGQVVKATVSDPGLLYRRALRSALLAQGIRVHRVAESFSGPVLTYRTGIAPALREMLFESSNFHAEQLLRVLGAETVGDGSFAGGVMAMRQWMIAVVGSVPESWRVSDGSGLSRTNDVTPALIATALQRGLTRPYGELLRESLPRAARDGTLEKRFRGSPVADQTRAKTGWIRGASALSGVVGRRVFSILMNYNPKRNGLNSKLKKFQERIVAAAAGLEGA